MRIYANEKYYASTDKDLINDFEELLKAEDSRIKDIAEQAIKDKIRSDLGINNILLLALNTEKTEAIIILFEKEKDGNFYKIHFDEELKNYYIEVN